MIETISPADLFEASDYDPYCRLAAVAGDVVTAWAGDGAVAWLRCNGSRPRFSAVGSARTAASLLPEVVSSYPDGLRASLPRDGFTHLPEELTVTDVDDWDWFCTATPPAPQRGEELAHWLDESGDEEVRALLREVSPGASTWPGDERARRWAGLRVPGRRLAATLADTGQHPAVGHLSSVATALAERGHGYGGALTAWTTRQMLAEGAELVTLGMHADNDTARHVYERLGFRCAHRHTGGVVKPVAAAHQAEDAAAACPHG